MVFLTACSKKDSSLWVQSPDESIEVEFNINTQGILEYQLYLDGAKIVGTSELSIFPNASVRILKAEVMSADTTWNPLWG